MLQALSALNNIAASTLVATASGSVMRLCRVSVVVAGSAAGAVHDAAATGDATAVNKVASIPNTVGVYEFDWPLVKGLVVVPGTGQTLAVSYR